MNNFFEELKRRNVIKASISYLVVAWLILQVASITFPILGVSPMVQKWILIVIAVGFPAWVVFAYIYELTPEGFKKTDEVATEDSIGNKTSKRLNAYIIGGLTLVVVALIFDKFFEVDVSLETSDRDRSVAVLPFTNLSASEDVYFAAGMTEDILTQISQIGDLRVLSNYTLNSYDVVGKTPEVMGKELGVSYVLTGNVRRSEDDLRISCQLVGTNNEGAIWAKTYDKRMTNMFDLQAEIATEIANTLAASLSDEEKEQLEQKPTDNLVAYDLYLKGREYTRGFSEDPDRLKGIELFKEAIVLDPSFSLAYSALASAYIFGIRRYGTFPGNYLDTALLLAQKAVDLGPDYSGNWGTLGTAYSQLGKREQAATMYKKALEINPSSSASINNLSNYYSVMGQFDKSVEMYKRSIAIKPAIDSTLVVNYANLADEYRKLGLVENALFCAQQAVSYREYYFSLFALGTAQFIAGDTVASLNSLGKMVDDDNRSIPSLSLATNMFYEYGNQALGIQYLQELKEKENFRYEDFPNLRTYEALELQKAGKYDSAELLLNQNMEFYLSQFERGRRFQGWLIDITIIYLALGQEDEAFKWLEKLMDDGFSDYVQIHSSHLFDGVKDHPEYLRIMGALKDRVDVMRQRVIDQEASEQLKGSRL